MRRCAVIEERADASCADHASGPSGTIAEPCNSSADTAAASRETEAWSYMAKVTRWAAGSRLGDQETGFSGMMVNACRRLYQSHTVTISA
jgi:hypothetical protein